MTSDDVGKVLTAIHLLPIEQRAVLVSRFGMITGKLLPLEEVAAATEERWDRDQVRSIENSAIGFIADWATNWPNV